MKNGVRLKILAPDPVWAEARKIAGERGCTVRDLMIQRAERIRDDPSYARSILTQYRLMFLPTGTWPSDPLDCLVISWMMAVRHVAIDHPDGTDPDDWWKGPPSDSQ
jgi:hypothetical protein